mmetsp:Transcript_15025/g.42165  ORF Transcript_15025/g.42165 Transcript_15025/m.42165 type:complete len:747 (+) Transcript_15025:116-2356(+)|eukprot:CAMPEP_0117656576 /NCGR_PEP_ID=MMETSP0804-20121206/4878_1 /TAXON_ID=1074897 /ORGANISM="Tetraselmis astigmatica, Strain CCMP880" /LENGTH=746 /DNA_ID=CAMNT_0005462987 /DNA_START=63 /DNA_END=2303 /DNA_ORIENTATION=+
MEDNVKHQGSSPLFAIFVLSLMVLFLVPYTLYKMCGSSEAETHKAWVGKDGKRKKSLGQRLGGMFTRGNIILMVMWGLVALLLLYIQTSQTEIAPFDPFSIMGLPTDASEKEIKKAYRALARDTHPDKNPDDPKANEKFDLLVKAYKALTDEVARENYVKYGHPDGPQAMNIGVALPTIFFNADKKTQPLMLLGLVGVGILLPLAVAACYLSSSNKYAGPNQVQHETLALWLTHHKFGIKESQGLRRIPDTLVVAKEFIDMPVPSDQALALDELKKLVTRFHPDLKDVKKDFWKRKSSIVKVHMLLLAFLERAEDEIPEILKPDLKFMLQRLPSLLAELMNVAVYPRKQYFLYGWMCPAIAVVEMMQCLTQAVPIRVRKPAQTGTAKADKGGEAAAVLLQLPFMDVDMIKKLSRKKIRTIADLAAMSEDDRSGALLSVGFPAEHMADVSTFLAAMPTVHAEGEYQVDGNMSIMEGDMVTANVRVALTRPAHKLQAVRFDVERVKGVEAYAPHYPNPRQEQWYFLLCDSQSNILISHCSATLLEAENAGAKKPENYGNASGMPLIEAAAKAPPQKANNAAAPPQADDDDDDLEVDDDEDELGVDSTELLDPKDSNEDDRQVVQLRFLAPVAGKYNFQLLIMSDCWIGCDTSVTMPMVVEKLNRAEREARDNAMYAAKAFEDSDEEDDGDDQDGEGEEEEDEDYDSEETGTDVSDDDVESLPDLVDADDAPEESIPGMDREGNVKKHN